MNWTVNLWRGWKRAARAIGDLQARILLTFVYFVVVGPFALAIRRFADPLAFRPGGLRGWRPRPTVPGTLLDQARRQS